MYRGEELETLAGFTTRIRIEFPSAEVTVTTASVIVGLDIFGGGGRMCFIFLNLCMMGIYMKLLEFTIASQIFYVNAYEEYFFCIAQHIY